MAKCKQSSENGPQENVAMGILTKSKQTFSISFYITSFPIYISNTLCLPHYLLDYLSCMYLFTPFFVVYKMRYI